MLISLFIFFGTFVCELLSLAPSAFVLVIQWYACAFVMVNWGITVKYKICLYMELIHVRHQ